MAEDIQGLKIVFGADFDQFERQLSAANKAVNSTQKQLNLLKKGLKLDPSSTTLLTEKFTVLGNQAQNLKTKINALSAQMAATSSEARNLAASESNIAMKAAQSLAAYNKLDASLATVKDKMKEIADNHDMGKAFSREDPLAFVDAITKAGVATDEEKAKLKELTAEYNRLHEAWQKVSKENTTAQDALKFQTAKIEAEKYRAELTDIYAQMSKIEYANLDKDKSAELKKLAQSAQLCESEMAALETRNEQLEKSLKSLSSSDDRVQVLAEKFENTKTQVQAAQTKIDALEATIKTLGVSAESIKGQSLLELKQNAAKAEEKFEQLNSELAETRGDIATVELSIKEFGNSTTTSATKIEKLQQELKELKTKEKELKTQTDEANASLRQTQNAVKGKEAAAEIATLTAKMKSLQQVSKTASYAITASVRDAATTMSATITPLLSIAGSAVMSKADEMDSAFRNMTKTVNGTDAEFEQLRQDAIAFSQTHAVSATQILEIEAMGGQLGIAVDELGEFAEVASNLDIATDMDADTIAEQLGQLNNIMQWGTGDMERYGDALVRLGNNMPAQESSISSVAKQIASMGSIIGMSTPEILAWSAAIASTGQGAESAGTAIQNTMSDIESAVAEGGDSLQAFADISGMSVDEFKSAWEGGNASDVMKSFIDGLKGIEANGGSATQALSDLGITGVRQVRAIEGLMQTVDNLDDALIMSQDAWDGVADEWGDAGDAAREAEKKQQGLSGSLQIMRNNAENLAATVGNELVFYVDMASGALESFTKILENSDGTFIRVSAALGLIVAAAGPIARVISQGYGSYVNFNKVVEQNRIRLIEAAVASGNLTAAQGANAVATGKYSKEVTAATKQVELHAKAQARASAAMAVGKAAAIGLAVAGIAFLGSKLVEYLQHQERVRAANATLADSYRSLQSSAETGGNAISTAMTTSYADAKQAADDIIQLNLDVIQGFKDNMTSVQNSNAELDTYAATLHNLGADMSNLSEGDVTRLNAALSGLNTLMGTNLQLVATENGYTIMQDDIEMTIAKIDALIQKKKEEIQVEAYQQTAVQNNQAIIAAQEKQKTALDALNNAQATYNTFQQLAQQGNVGAAQSLEGLNINMQLAQQRYNEATAGVDALQSKQAELTAALEIVSAAMDSNATATESAIGANSNFASALSTYGVESLSAFATYCDYAGISVDTLESASASEVDSMISDWKNWASGVDSSVSEASDAIASCPDAVVESLEDIPDAAEENVDAATEKLETLEDVMNYVAENGVDGLVEGLRDGKVYVSQAAKELVDSAKQTLTLTLQIASPSKVMRKIGRFTGEGFALGIQDEQKYATKVASKLSQSTMGAIHDGAYASNLGSRFVSSNKAFYTTQQTVNSGDTMLITNLTIETKDVDSADSLYKQLRRVALQNRR